MRALFGLVSLLVVVGVMLFIFKQYEAPVIKNGEKAKDEARQISGHGDDGKAAITSFQTQGKMRGSTLEGLVVTSVEPGGAMEQYGLKVGDEIVTVNGTDITTISNDPDTAKAMAVQNGFQGGNPVVVVRGGQRVTLPDKGGTGANTPGAPQNNSVKDQLKNMGIQTK